jgi:hypothetical protein
MAPYSHGVRLWFSPTSPALQFDSNKSEIACRYGISRGRLYQLLEIALTDPRGKLREAEKEGAFRREVLRLAR